MTEKIAESPLDAIRWQALQKSLAACRGVVQRVLTALRDEALPGIGRLAGSDLVEVLHEGAFDAIDAAIGIAWVDLDSVTHELVELRNDLNWRLERDYNAGCLRPVTYITRPTAY
jgi:hypothetical protein